MKKTVEKPQIRKEIEAQVEDFLAQGGTVNRVERGISGRENVDGPLPGNTLFTEGKTNRTYVPDVVAALETRRKAKPPTPSKPNRKRDGQGRKVPIFDDFGEVVRWVWQDA